MSEYPEHDKMQAAMPAAQVVGDFLEWLTEVEPIHILARYEGTPPRLEPSPVGIEDLLYEYFGIDRDKIEAEKRQMLERVRTDQDLAAEVAKPCPKCPQCGVRGGHKMDCSETR